MLWTSKDLWQGKMYVTEYLMTKDTPVLKGGIQIGGTMTRYIGKDIQKLGEEEGIWQDQVATCG